MQASLSSSKLKWYWHRMRAMSVPEVMARVDFAVKKRQWRQRDRWVAPQPDLSQWLTERDRWRLPSLSSNSPEAKGVLAEAEGYLQGNYCLLNLHFHEAPFDWHRDPQTGVRAPLIFGPDLDYRDPKVAGNFRNIWEKNRQHHLTILALAYALSGDERYASAVETQIQQWIDQNPVPLGINWTSSLEVGIRLISWVWIERLLRGSASGDRLFGAAGLLWPSIYWHQWLLTQHYSHGSSANNHLVGEMAGLLIAALAWPVFATSRQWQTLASGILEREVARQTYPSGLNREQAFSYQIFALEFFVLAGLEAERWGCPLSASYQMWVKRMLDVLPALLDVGGNLPTYGDSDDGKVLVLRPMQASRLDWLLRVGQSWLAAQVPLPPGDSGQLAAALVYPEGTKDGQLNPASTSRPINHLVNHLDDSTPHPPGAPSAPPSAAGSPPASSASIGFEDAGLYVLASRRGQADEVFCLADAGPLGFLSIAAHGHADALSFSLSVGGVPVIVDPGTYVYHSEPHWRAYFKGTKAHNTLAVDDEDQSESGGAFLWMRKAATVVQRWETTPTGGELVAEHDGYCRLPEAVVHQRQLCLRDRHLSILDNLRGGGTHRVEWRLHFAPGCAVTLEDQRGQVTWQTGQLSLDLDPQLNWRIVEQQSDAGWYAPGFNLKEPAPTLIGSLKAPTPITFKNQIEVVS
ncbi:MAG: alginate lyase family protein [Synechococcales bacterium]|nr:alginate lyase family protein [Synechococcales bacterium]